MQNKILKEYTKENIFNMEDNYNEIMKKANRENRRKRNNLLLGIAAVVIVAACAVTMINKPNTLKPEMKIEYKVSSTQTGYGMIEDTYMEKVNMDYVVQDGISMKVDSIEMTDDHFEAILNIKFEKDVDLTSKMISLDQCFPDSELDRLECTYAIYDDENNIYTISERIIPPVGTEDGKINLDYTKYIYSKLGLKYNEQNMYDNQLGENTNVGILNKTDNNVLYCISLDTHKNFPKSKKLIMRITNLGNHDTYSENYSVVRTEDNKISDAEWVFEIDIPEKFYQRETTELTLEKNIENLEIEKFEVSETGLVITCKYDGIGEFIANGRFVENFGDVLNEYFHISDEDGNMYYADDLGTVGEDKITAKFRINKNYIKKNLILTVNKNNANIIIKEK